MPAISTKGFSRFPRTLFVVGCNSRELQVGKVVYRRNVRYLRPACLRVRTYDSDTNFSLGHGSTSPFCKVIDMNHVGLLARRKAPQILLSGYVRGASARARTLLPSTSVTGGLRIT
jgi:hypothetical protein